MNHATSTNCIFPITDFTEVKDKVLNWANRFSIFCFLDNHQYQQKDHSVECILAAGVIDLVQCDAGNALDQLQQFISAEKRWLFGHLGYDLKNEIENLYSFHTDPVQFPDLYFFQPAILVRFDKDTMIIESNNEDEEEIFREINSCSKKESVDPAPISIQNRVDKAAYTETIRKLQQHILRGDCYEINFCQEFFAENVALDPIAVYKKLSSLSPNPFSALYKLDHKFLVCASPERYLKKQKNRILSQPIKGTARRMAEKSDDDKKKTDLFYDAKERSENVMVVDLVRNDLSKVCAEGTVTVDELYGIYSFPQVHQMISSVSGELRHDVSFADIIRATFPMGSMTGAPKKKVMELIEQYENTKRGIFSGAVGYIDPEGDFDFNVVIRSIMYNESRQYLSFQTGSAVTFYCDADKEWEESMLKAEAIKKVLER